MSSSSSTMAALTLLLATTTLLSTTAASGGGPIDVAQDSWQLSVAAQRAFGPGTTTVAMLHDVDRRSGGARYTVYTSAGNFDMQRASLRLAFDPARLRDGLHSGCTYRFTHHGPRAQFNYSRNAARVVYPNIIGARHIPTAECPTNDAPSAEWARRDAERSLGRFCHLNRMTSAECDALRQRRP